MNAELFRLKDFNVHFNNSIGFGKGIIVTVKAVSSDIAVDIAEKKLINAGIRPSSLKCKVNVEVLS